MENKQALVRYRNAHEWRLHYRYNKHVWEGVVRVPNLDLTSVYDVASVHALHRKCPYDTQPVYAGR